jgi:protein TonB
MPSVQHEIPSLPTAGTDPEPTTGADQAATPGHGGAAGQNQGGSSSGSGATSLQGAGGKSDGGAATFTFGDPNGPGIARLVWPEYPREARRLGKAGTVILKLSLDASGEVNAVEILRAAGFGMEEAAREAALRSRFRPATLNGRPVACQAILPLHFQLR